MVHIFQDGIIGVPTDESNVGILVFLVILGAMVSLMNKAGGSAAFGRFAAKGIKTRVGAQLATILLGGYDLHRRLFQLRLWEVSCGR